jgi:hypothetical protein
LNDSLYLESFNNVAVNDGENVAVNKHKSIVDTSIKPLTENDFNEKYDVHTIVSKKLTELKIGC